MDYDLKIYNNKKSNFKCLRTNHFFNIYFVFDGAITILKNNDFQHYRTGDIFYIHDYECINDINFEGTLLCLSINNYYYYKISNTYAQNENNIMDKDSPDLKTLYNDVIASILNQSITSDIERKLLFLIEATYFNTIDTTLRSESERNFKHVLIRDVIQYISHNCERKLNCQDIAHHFFVNNSFLSREFSALMSCTLSNYIIASKIHFSACALLNGDALDFVWRQYHFHSLKDYIYYFQAIKGVSPYEINNKQPIIEGIQNFKIIQQSKNNLMW
ncbi:transcriptional regulator [Staphylococcus equorum]|uniref:transcriptional regulator n=1 Tax=Staphylococcus TaxID=1279 RepID=UPI000853C3B6|nr:transcriptional regulator [Staphylococcus equorum]MDG0821927.1 transcriptional regulator [Staphylococcus equorum]MDG0838428.1 transcriptional regulator [Staphylococcus equorum]MDK9877114.1 transcriptional regulator [Staphylococcus equorum]MDN6849921.1 transcriptional regulator [Staphylococcus equorum]OEK69502.1 transcriptional regulator [Staphylococcus equorum]